ncbi:hypothetical protein LSAT2_025369 [Lamellibrachia satsuma]|nr:hypothetical protein LSAT2_025369 [Lamellibrachia satsuma]
MTSGGEQHCKAEVCLLRSFDYHLTFVSRLVGRQVYSAMKTRARTQHGKEESQQGHSTKKTCGKGVKKVDKGPVRLPPAVSGLNKRPLASGSKELQNLLGHILCDEELVKVMADTVRKKCERLKKPDSRRSSLRSSPKKIQLFQLAPVKEKKTKCASDDADSDASKKLKFTSAKFPKESNIPKTGKKAAEMRMKRAEELRNKPAVVDTDLPIITKGVDNSKCMPTQEGSASPRRSSTGGVVSSVVSGVQCQDSNISRSVVTCCVEKLTKSTENATREETQLSKLVWAKLSRQVWWPGMVIKGTYCGLKPARPRHLWIFWFGDHKVSECKEQTPTSIYRQSQSRPRTARILLLRQHCVTPFRAVRITITLDTPHLSILLVPAPTPDSFPVLSVVDATYEHGDVFTIIVEANATPEAGQEAAGGAISGTTGGAVSGTTGGAGQEAAGGAVSGTTGGAGQEAAGGAVSGTTGGAVSGTTGGAGQEAAGGAVSGTTGGAGQEAAGGAECVDRVRLNMGCDGNLDEDTSLDWAKSGFLVNGQSNESHMKPNPDRPIPEFAMACLRKIKELNDTDDDDDIDNDDIAREEAPFRIEKHHPREVCIACGEERPVVEQHPLFEGGLCQFCKVFCVICGNGGELFVCENTACNRAYCTGCIAELTGGLESVEAIKRISPWTCYMCVNESQPSSLLVKKADWQCNLIALFQPASIHQVR